MVSKKYFTVSVLMLGQGDKGSATHTHEYLPYLSVKMWQENVPRLTP